MAKKEKIKKDFIHPKWFKIKEMYEQGTNGSDKYGTNFPVGGELDELCLEFIALMAFITERNGYDYVVEGVKLDLWKDRIWCLVENAGLLPEIAWKDEREKEELDDIKDDWYNSEDEFSYEEIEEPEML